jgi:type II secretory pathway component PulM
MVTGLVRLNNNVTSDVDNLSHFTVYSKQAATTYKAVNQVEANSFTQVSSDQIKGDITQVLQIKDPDILIQSGQMTVNVPNAQFSQVMILLDQFRKSYAIFPSQVTITRQSQSGYVAFNATFWVKQQ